MEVVFFDPYLREHICSYLEMKEAGRLLLVLRISECNCSLPLYNRIDQRFWILPGINPVTINIAKFSFYGLQKVFKKFIVRGKRPEVLALLFAGVDIYSVNKSGQSALAIAAQHREDELVKLFLELGMDVNDTNNTGWTPLMPAAANGHNSTILLLVAAGARVNIANNYGDTALNLARRYGQHQSIRLLKSLGATDCGYTY